MNPTALQIAIRKMLHEDDSMSMMLFFGFVGALNAVCLAPVLLTLHLLGFVTAAGLTLRVFALTVCKGAATTHALLHAPLLLPLTRAALYHVQLSWLLMLH